jgi:hypothetical protein
MLKDVVEVVHRGGHRLFLRFEDGTEGEIDLSERLTFEGVFASLRAEGNFAQVALHAELGTIGWPTGADLDPDVLYAWVKGVPAPGPDDPHAPRQD